MLFLLFYAYVQVGEAYVAGHDFVFFKVFILLISRNNLIIVYYEHLDLCKQGRMTSRRSRLKAVTNLPVRRKPLTSQSSADEVTTVENFAPQKTYSNSPRSEFISVFNKQKDCVIPDKEIKENEQVLITNFSDGESRENGIVENVINDTNEFEITGKLQSTIGLATTVPTSKTDNNSSSTFKSDKCFKPNVISSCIDKTDLPPVETNEAKQTLDQQNCTIISEININNNNINSNNSINNNIDSRNYENYNEIKNCNNNILEEGDKCYAVLTTQNVTLSPLSEYTITPLTPCDNTYNSPNVSDEYPAQEYEEVHVYTNIEDNELYVNEDSAVETAPSEPIVIQISNNCSENELNKIQINFGNLNQNYIATNNVHVKSNFKNKTENLKNNISSNCVSYKNTSLQAKDSHSSENSVNFGSHVPADLHSYKQCISTIRRKRPKSNNFTKKLADAKREFQKKYEKTKPDRSTLKMIDLIFYNPTTNPMESKNKFEKKDASVSPSDVIQNMLEEEKVDEPEVMQSDPKSQMVDNYETENMNKMPVPQVKIGLDGEIILDEKSIIIETTEAKKGREELLNSVPVFEDRGCRVSYYRAKSRKSRDWTDFETKRFYKALNTIGPDFSLMQKYFPKRSRLELKNKFKREEKLNRNLIDKALNNPSEFDMTELEKDLAVEKEAEEEEVEMRLCKIMKHSTKKPRVKSSVLSREMVESDVELENSRSKLLESDSRRFVENNKNKKKIEYDFVLQKLLMEN